MSINKAIASPIEIKVGKGQRLRFRRIGLDVWSEFCEHVSHRRSKSVQALSIADKEKANLYRDLVGKGIDMDDMLSEASTMDGMTWILCRCCLDKEVDDSVLMQVIPFGEIASLFHRLADLSESDNEGVADDKTAETAGNA